jgi:hypothetical protein
MVYFSVKVQLALAEDMRALICESKVKRVRSKLPLGHQMQKKLLLVRVFFFVSDVKMNKIQCLFVDII